MDEVMRRVGAATSAEDLMYALEDLRRQVDSLATTDDASRVLSALDQAEAHNPLVWTSAALALKRAIQDHVYLVLDTLSPRRQSTMSEGHDSMFSQVMHRMSQGRRSTSAASAGTSTARVWGSSRPSSSIGGAMTSSSDTLLRSLGSFIGVTMAETVYCQICLEYVDIAATCALDACGHRFCVACMEMYLASKIQDGLVYPKCFFAEAHDTCDASIDAADIRALTSAVLFDKYEKFKFSKEHTGARECPFCHVVQVGGGAENPAMTCVHCGHEFCFSHSNAHMGSTCAAYEKARRAEEKLNQAKISQIAKPCPGCQTPVEKSGGCNQMKCITCGVNFCWLCGQEVDGGVFPEHFQWWNLAGCAGAQMSESTTPSLLAKVTWFCFRLVLCLVFAPPALALTLVCSIVSCCCIPCFANGRGTARSAFLGCFCVSGWVFMAPIVLVLALPFVPFYLMGLLCCPHRLPSFGSEDAPQSDQRTLRSSSQRAVDATDVAGPYRSV
ncbi:Aste57867_21164 [Aphanomyces stellatus]|uniref:RBR-type E3 ubiquitin transferase n=1 Tax=Aphanomyces stellatus TaxID=120398 RepID=A0A485LI31_9STRA|nr:hypothetical protein As57867_021096 [Aphanomyces stellatus]VFT97838.1 Aste57867_21164 [Aphanomyces stellatus]